MNAARQFYYQNSALVQNVIYLLALSLVCYLVYSYLTAGFDTERYVIQVKMTNSVYGIPGNASSALIPSNKKGSVRAKYCLNYDDSKKKSSDFIPNPNMRIVEGADFTISWWMYINTWDAAKMGVIKPVLAISDPNVSNPALKASAAYVMTTFLYPTKNMLGIRFHTRGVGSDDLTWITRFLSNATSAATAQQTLNTEGYTPLCDINDIDMQRWLNFTCVVSGRILDVYYDGKLNRSCVLPGPVVGSAPGSGDQYVIPSIAGGFNGFLNSVFFSGLALTPDRIYGLYQEGPQGSTSIIRSLFNKIGIKLNYNNNNRWEHYL